MYKKSILTCVFKNVCLQTVRLLKLGHVEGRQSLSPSSIDDPGQEIFHKKCNTFSDDISEYFITISKLQ